MLLCLRLKPRFQEIAHQILSILGELKLFCGCRYWVETKGEGGGGGGGCVGGEVCVCMCVFKKAKREMINRVFRTSFLSHQQGATCTARKSKRRNFKVFDLPTEQGNIQLELSVDDVRKLLAQWES